MPIPNAALIDLILMKANIKSFRTKIIEKIDDIFVTRTRARNEDVLSCPS